MRIKAKPVRIPVSAWRVLVRRDHDRESRLAEGTDLLTSSSTHPSQQRLLLSHMVNEAQGPGGAMEASMQAVIQVGQSLSLLLSAVRGL